MTIKWERLKGMANTLIIYQMIQLTDDLEQFFLQFILGNCFILVRVGMNLVLNDMLAYSMTCLDGCHFVLPRQAHEE